MMYSGESAGESERVAALPGTSQATPILMYHAFGAPDEAPSRYVMPVQRFAQQMAVLKWLRYRVLGLSEFLDILSSHGSPPRRSVVITMDDGYRDNRTVALPILQRYGFSATVFIATGSVGGVNEWSRGDELAGRPMMSWVEIQQLCRAGVTIGAHTRTHPRLTTLSHDDAQAEIAGSRMDLERELNVSVRLFSYPYGDHDPAVRALAAAAGFTGCCGTKAEKNWIGTPVTELRRTEVYGTDRLIDFVRKLRSGERPEWRPRHQPAERLRPTHSVFPAERPLASRLLRALRQPLRRAS